MRQGLKRIINIFRDSINIPKELAGSTQYKILHISDTPSAIYYTIITMITELAPHMIIHTGDIADDIKLGDNPGYEKQYRRTAGPFIKQLRLSAPEILLIPGNHDSPTFIESIAPHNMGLPGSVIDCKGHTLGVAHYITDLPDNAEYMLYGHNDDMPENSKGAVFLNGVTGINIILLPSGEVFSLPYPHRTNHHRKYKEYPPTLI